MKISTNNLHGVLMIKNNKIHDQSTAVLKILRGLRGGWPLLYGFIILPKFVRDAVYHFISKNRYK